MLNLKYKPEDPISELLKTVPYKVKHIQAVINDTDWRHDEWVCVINGETFEYNTGMAFRKPTPAWKREWGKDTNHVLSRLTPYGWENFIKESTPMTPNLHDVIWSLSLDYDAADKSFITWCEEYGLNSDSIKDCETYHKCQKNATKFRKCFLLPYNISISQLNDYFDDY